MEANVGRFQLAMPQQRSYLPVEGAEGGELVNMGFSRERVEAALAQTGGDSDAALNVMLADDAGAGPTDSADRYAANSRMEYNPVQEDPVEREDDYTATSYTRREGSALGRCCGESACERLVCTWNVTMLSLSSAMLMYSILR